MKTITTADCVKKLRKRNNITQAELADKLGMSRPKVIAIEKGEHDPTIGEIQRIAEVFDVVSAELFPSYKFDYDKYKAMYHAAINFGADKDGKITKTKLAKLLYFIDFTWFYKEKEPISGLYYRKIQQGPVPDAFFRLTDQLFEDGDIDIQFKEDSQLISNYNFEKNLEINKLLTSKETQLIKEIGEKWRGHRTQVIVNFTHKQTPWEKTEEGELIPYDLILQESGPIY